MKKLKGCLFAAIGLCMLTACGNNATEPSISNEDSVIKSIDYVYTSVDNPAPLGEYIPYQLKNSDYGKGDHLFKSTLCITKVTTISDDKDYIYNCIEEYNKLLESDTVQDKYDIIDIASDKFTDKDIDIVVADVDIHIPEGENTYDYTYNAPYPVIVPVSTTDKLIDGSPDIFMAPDSAYLYRIGKGEIKAGNTVHTKILYRIPKNKDYVLQISTIYDKEKQYMAIK